MRLILLLVFALIALIGFMFFVVANDVMTVEADILGPAPPVLSIQVPDYVYIGNVSKGTETDEIKISVNNTGNVPILIRPKLVNETDEIFSNLFMTRRLSGATFEWKQIGDFSMNMSAPGTSGVESDYFYLKLSLKSYNGEINNDMLGKKADVKFIVSQYS